MSKFSKKLLDGLADSVPDTSDLEALLNKIFKARQNYNNSEAEDLLIKIGALVSKIESSAHLVGRVAVRYDVKGPRPEELAYKADVIPVVFEKAIEFLVGEDASLAQVFQIAADEARKIYGFYTDKAGKNRYPKGEAMARMLDSSVSATVAASLKTGNIPNFGGLAQTLVRTVTTKAYSYGRQREAEVLTSEGFETGFEFQTAGDVDVRDGKNSHENHKAMDGIKALESDSVWEYFSPPLGFNCRCLLVPQIGGPWTKNALQTARKRGARAEIGFGSKPI